MIDPKAETLLTAARLQSFTRAAEELCLTQPAVSHHISQLEKELGAKLFLRGKNGLKLTPEGELAVKYARRMKAMYEQLKTETSDFGKHLTKLRVGITHTSESNEVAEVLARYSSQNPGVKIMLITESINNLYDMLENYELDLAITEGKPHNPQLHSLLLDTDYLVCVVANENPLAQKSMVTLEEIRREKLILRLPHSETRNLFLSHLMSLHESIDSFNVILEVDNIATITDCIRKDLGISILAKGACMADLREGKITVLPIENLSMVRQTNIVYHEDFSHSEVLQGFLDLYHKSVGDAASPAK